MRRAGKLLLLLLVVSVTEGLPAAPGAWLGRLLPRRHSPAGREELETGNVTISENILEADGVDMEDGAEAAAVLHHRGGRWGLPSFWHHRKELPMAENLIESDGVEMEDGAEATAVLHQRGGRWRLPSFRHHRKELSTRELKRLFDDQTQQFISSLKPEQRAALDRLRDLAYGPGVSEHRKAVADQMAVWGVRDAMLITFLDRKNWNATLASEQFERIIEWRLENDLDNVLHSPSLPEAKILKHRQCWPTALYVHKEGDIDPIFVDRMGILELDRLRRGPVALTIDDMMAYYVLTMEARRRLLFPKLSQERGRLVTRYISVVDVSRFGPQHFGADAMSLMREMGRVFDLGNYSSLVGRLLIINVPWAFRQVWALVKGIVSEELEGRLMLLSKKQAYEVLSEMVPPEMARDIIEGNYDQERKEEAELHAFLDEAARAREHHKRFYLF